MSEPWEPLGSAEDVSRHLGVPLATLQKWRWQGTGPKSLKIGRHIRYRFEDVEAWLDEQARLPKPAA